MSSCLFHANAEKAVKSHVSSPVFHGFKKNTYFLSILSIFLITSCTSKEYVYPMEYNSRKECQQAAEKAVENEVQKGIDIIKKEEFPNLFFYSREVIIDGYSKYVTTNCKFDNSTKKWKYNLTGNMYFNYRYRQEILKFPWNWGSMLMWTGDSLMKKISINDISLQMNEHKKTEQVQKKLIMCGK